MNERTDERMDVGMCVCAYIHRQRSNHVSLMLRTFVRGWLYPRWNLDGDSTSCGFISLKDSRRSTESNLTQHLFNVRRVYRPVNREVIESNRS